jgi:hypothetical protein
MDDSGSGLQQTPYADDTNTFSGPDQVMDVSTTTGAGDSFITDAPLGDGLNITDAGNTTIFTDDTMKMPTDAPVDAVANATDSAVAGDAAPPAPEGGMVPFTIMKEDRMPQATGEEVPGVMDQAFTGSPSSSQPTKRAAGSSPPAWSFPSQVVLASLVGVQGLAWVSGRFLLAAVGPGIASALSFAPSALAVLGLWGAAGASSALGAQYLLQGFQLIATGGMLAPPGPYMQNYKDVAEVATWALDPQALAGWQRPAQVVPTGVRSVLARATQASIDWFQVSWLAGWLAGWLAPPCRAQMLAR